MYRVVRNGFRKMSILWVNFTTEDGISNPETSFVWWFNRIKMFVISFKKPFHYPDIQIFLIFSLPFHTFQIQKDKWKLNNLCHELPCINLQV